ncbi:hypothetical protein ACLB1T_06515 [Escherichia coli]
MGLYDKYARLAGERLQFSDNGLTPFGTCIDAGIPPPKAGSAVKK